MKLKTTVTYTMLSVAFAAGTTIAQADAGHARTTSHAKHEAQVRAAAGADAASSNVEDTLHAIHGKQSELAEVVANKQLDDVHHLAFAIRDLAKPLAEKVSADRRPKVEGTISNIAKLADELDASGDAGDQAKTEANVKKLDGTVKLLEAQVTAK